MRHFFNLSYIVLHESEVYINIKFVDSQSSTFLEFLVPIPSFNRSLNDALKIGNALFSNTRLSINGVSFPIRFSELLIVKQHFDSLTK